MRTVHAAVVRGLCVALGVVTLGCGSASENVSEQSSDSLSIRLGIDYAWSKPSPSSIRAAGYTFAARYLSYDPSKNLTSGELQALRADGIDVVVVWEYDGTAALSGYNQGASDAAAAEAQADALGIPAGRPIYFAVDFDATPGEQGAIDSYFDGVASVIGRDLTGAYADFYVVERLYNAGKIKWAWQTYAWSGGQWDSRAQLRQTLNGINVGGASCDRDEAVAVDFGQWGYKPGKPITGLAGKCVDVAGSDTADGTHVQLYDCNGTAAQQWTIDSNGSLSALGKCMDVTFGGTTNGTLIQLWSCNGTGSQVWKPQSDGTLLNPQSGKCLDVPGFNSANGTQLQIWTCHGTSNQIWHLP